ncbi:MAG TPA: hypothetical protein VGQ17_12510 [Gemmatimonadales bacterium]|jgi:hypothetical protein|nr:hypothetical protein [Gemmatimonadales bacterium]
MLPTGAHGRLAAQDGPARAQELERRGEYPAAAVAWRGVLAARPGDFPALLGLERSLTPLGRLGEMVPELRTVLRRDSSPGVLGVAIRVWTAARQPDSARAAAERWARAEPESEAPFQEWGMAAFAARDRTSAKAAYLLGRQRLGRPDLLAAELGQVAAADGDYALAAREWTAAVRKVPSYRQAAISILSQVPAAGRPALLRELGQAGNPGGERLAALLMARWGEPVAAVKRLAAALPSDDRAAFEAIQEMIETLRGPATPEVLRARAVATELLADRSSGNQRVSLRLDAARAYADAGDQAAARRMLAGLAGDPAATPAMATSASSTLVGVLVDEGHLAEADRRFTEIGPQLSADDRERLALRLAEGWIRNGRLGRADSLLAADSSVDALAVRGRIALYRGDLGTASELLAEAGPFTGERADATGRIGLLGLLQLVDSDSMPALGEALYKLERRDSAAAAAALEKVAQSVGPEHGGAELLLLAGRVRAGLGQGAEAERLYRAAVTQAVPAGSAAAELALAELLLREGKNEPAIAALEHLLLTWPTSSVVPQARRLLDVARGAVPSA